MKKKTPNATNFKIENQSLHIGIDSANKHTRPDMKAWCTRPDEAVHGDTDVMLRLLA